VNSESHQDSIQNNNIVQKHKLINTKFEDELNPKAGIIVSGFQGKADHDPDQT
jgi:hypothetical protein